MKPSIAVTLLSLVFATGPSVVGAEWPELVQRGRAAFERGRFPEAEEHFRAAAAMASALPPGDPRVARAANNLAALHHALGRYAEAEREYRRALEWHRLNTPAPEIEFAMVTSNLATVLRAQGKLRDAEPYARQAVEWAERLGDREAEAQFRFNLAEILRGAARTEEAADTARKALALAGSKELLTAHICQSLAILALQSGDAREAEVFQLRAVAIFESKLTAPHPLLASAASNLGQVLAALDRLDEARAPLESALEQWRRTVGPAHANIAVALNNLGQWHAKKGDSAAAENHLRQAIQVWESTVGPGHPDIARAQLNLGALFEAQGKLRGADSLYSRSFRRLELSLGLAHPDTVRAGAALARIRDLQQRTTEAKAIRHKAGLAGSRVGRD